MFFLFSTATEGTWTCLIVTVYVLHLPCAISYACVVHTVLRQEFCACFIFIPCILHAPHLPPFVNNVEEKLMNCFVIQFFQFSCDVGTNPIVLITLGETRGNAYMLPLSLFL
jgi:hypothetical protein